MTHLNIKLSGKVQGVGFRYDILQVAEKLNLNGFARNESDGTVYLEIESEQKDVDTFLDWCKTGPRYAKVENIENTPGEFKGFTTFETQ